MKLNMFDQQSAQRAADACLSVDLEKRWSVVIKEAKSTRSVNQNSLMWKWLDIIRLHILDSTGQAFSADEMHEWFKAKFLPSTVVEVDGDAIRCRTTTTKLNTAEMAAYLDIIDKYCADSLHLYLPQPGQEED